MDTSNCTSELKDFSGICNGTNATSTGGGCAVTLPSIVNARIVPLQAANIPHMPQQASSLNLARTSRCYALSCTTTVLDTFSPITFVLFCMPCCAV